MCIIGHNSPNQLELLQAQFNELVVIGVFKKPEDSGITIEHLNPSFLVKKDLTVSAL